MPVPPASVSLPKHDLLNCARSIAPALTTATSTPQEPEPETKKPKEEKEVKPAKKPDEDALKEKIGEQDEKIAALQARLQKIKDRLDNRESHSDNSKIGAAKAKFKAAQQESRRYQQEKRNIFDEISAADDMRKQQQDLTNRLKSELQFFSVEEIERRIKALEHQQQTTSLSVKEDKKMMEDIKRLRSNIPLVKQYDEAQESLRGIKEHHNDLYTRLKAKAAELSASKETEEGLRGEMDAAVKEEESKKSDMPSLFKEREGLRAEINKHRDEIRKLRDEVTGCHCHHRLLSTAPLTTLHSPLSSSLLLPTVQRPAQGVVRVPEGDPRPEEQGVGRAEGGAAEGMG